jgi:3-oxoacyl-[acyl-carrier-protein] synthase III
MVVIKKAQEKKVRTLPCDDCGTEVPVGDDAIGVICTNCTHKRQMIYEKAIEVADDEGDDNLTVEGTNAKVKAKKPKVKVLRKRKVKKSKVK